MKLQLKQKSILPGFGLALGFTVLYLSLLVLIPLAATFLKASSLTWLQFWKVVSSHRAVASYRLSFGAGDRSNHQSFLRADRRVGAGAVRIPRQAPV